MNICKVTNLESLKDPSIPTLIISSNGSQKINILLEKLNNFALKEPKGNQLKLSSLIKSSEKLTNLVELFKQSGSEKNISIEFKLDTMKKETALNVILTKI